MKMTILLAYLDPSAGSIWMQVLFGGLFGGAAVARQYWGEIRRWMGMQPRERVLPWK